MPEPLELHYWPTPNSWKVAIFLEEAGIPYDVKLVDITTGEQFEEEFLRVSPNGKTPAIVDPEGPDGEPISVFESGAILIYLAEKTGKFLPKSPREKYRTLEWLMFQAGHVGPVLEQLYHLGEDAPEQSASEASRFYGTMDRSLAETEYFGGEEYTIADIALYPWLSLDILSEEMAGNPNLLRWRESVGSRPAVRRALELHRELRRPVG